MSVYEIASKVQVFGRMISCIDHVNEIRQMKDRGFIFGGFDLMRI